METRHAEPIMVALNSERVPVVFSWQGRNYKIDGIDRIWRLSPKQKRDYRMYRIRSRNLTFVLGHEPRQNHWSLLKSPARLRMGAAMMGMVTRFRSA